VNTLKLLANELERTGIGRFEVKDDEFARGVREQQGVGSHNYGTTRMAATPQKGVVDRDCRVFGVGNLYVASSSVFPTSSFANPALSICAFSVRLATHIKNKSRKDPLAITNEKD
jgi:choline dehydrogenase-like flavoprotein